MNGVLLTTSFTKASKNWIKLKALSMTSCMTSTNAGASLEHVAPRLQILIVDRLPSSLIHHKMPLLREFTIKLRRGYEWTEQFVDYLHRSLEIRKSTSNSSLGKLIIMQKDKQNAEQNKAITAYLKAKPGVALQKAKISFASVD